MALASLTFGADCPRFKGLTAKIFHVVLMTAFSFVAYEKIVAVCVLM